MHKINFTVTFRGNTYRYTMISQTPFEMTPYSHDGVLVFYMGEFVAYTQVTGGASGMTTVLGDVRFSMSGTAREHTSATRIFATQGGLFPEGMLFAVAPRLREPNEPDEGVLIV